MEDEQGVDVTLAPIAERTEIEFRRDTSIYSSEELSIPADFQRTREYRSLYPDDAVGSRLSGRVVQAGDRRRPGMRRCRRVRADMLPTDWRLSSRRTSPRQGMVDAFKLTGLQRAVLTIWREN